MKLIVAGSRTIPESLAFSQILEFFAKPPVSLPTPLEVVSGGARGVDTAARDAAKYLMLNFREFPADWEKFGKSAGPRRNKHMAEYGDALLLIWDGESRGSANMKSWMQLMQKPVWEVILRDQIHPR